MSAAAEVKVVSGARQDTANVRPPCHYPQHVLYSRLDRRRLRFRFLWFPVAAVVGGQTVGGEESSAVVERGVVGHPGAGGAGRGAVDAAGTGGQTARAGQGWAAGRPG